MGVTTGWRSGVSSDAGRVRGSNEDRSFTDDEQGVFLVVDGVGGHAGGDRAAEIAREIILLQLHQQSKLSIPDRMRNAIVAANNEIHRLSLSDPALAGMGCVLTLAGLHEGHMTLAHVGDSRLYLIWNGGLRKMTSDHSPVGEREDSGELTEEEAMLHPRRHEVFRDVGSQQRTVEEDGFVEVRDFPFHSNAAVLLCSDGLTDMLTSAEILAIIERYDGDPAQTARDLVDTANEAGGLDNVTAIFVAGPDFLGTGSPQMQEARERHSITRVRPDTPLHRRMTSALTTRASFLIYGFLLGIALAAAFLKFR